MLQKGDMYVINDKSDEIDMAIHTVNGGSEEIDLWKWITALHGNVCFFFSE